MKTRINLAAACAGALIMLAGSTSFSQTEQPEVADPFAALKPGHWVKIKGVMQEDSTGRTLIAKEVKVLTGAKQEDDCEIEAPIARIGDKSQKQLEVCGIQVNMQNDATYESEDKSASSFDGLQPGMRVVIEGTYLKAGTFKGREMQLKAASGAEVITKLVGKAEKIDATAKTIALMGITCQITGDTTVKTAVK